MPLRICLIFTLLGRPPGLAGGIKGSRIAHSWSERSLAYGFIEVITSSLSTSFSLNYFYYITFPASNFDPSTPFSGLFVQPLVLHSSLTLSSYGRRGSRLPHRHFRMK